MQENMIPILYFADTCRLCHAVIRLLDGIGYSYKKARVIDNPKREGWDMGDEFISLDVLPAVPALYFPGQKKMAVGYRIAEVVDNGKG